MARRNLIGTLVALAATLVVAPTTAQAHQLGPIPANCNINAFLPCDGSLSNNEAKAAVYRTLGLYHSGYQLSPAIEGAYGRINSSATYYGHFPYADKRLDHRCLVDIDYVPGVPYRYYVTCDDGTRNP